MPVTLTDEQIQQLNAQLEAGKRSRQVEDMVNGIWTDPALSNEAKALFKRKYPDIPIEGYDVEQKVNARLDAEKKERDDAERKAREERQDNHQREQRKKTQADYGFTDDAMTRLEQLMVERNIGDYEVAAEYLASREPKPSDDQGGYNSHYWNHQDQDQFKAIASDPEKWAYNEILTAARADQQRQRQQR
jgi:hypothetical protein